MFTILRTPASLLPFDFNEPETANQLCGASGPSQQLLGQTTAGEKKCGGRGQQADSGTAQPLAGGTGTRH